MFVCDLSHITREIALGLWFPPAWPICCALASTVDKGSFCEVPGLAQTPCSSGTPDNAFSPFPPLQSKDARTLVKLLNFGINWGFL